jgi:hypothetical protein
MSATIDSQPATPASAYRPLVFKALRVDPPGSQVIHIYVADSTLASTLGIEVGQIVVKHATIIGDVPAVAGQTVRLYQNCGAYGDYVTQYGKGIYMILDEISSGGFLWMVIDAPNLGDYTPSGSPTAALKIWLNNYTFYLRVLVYTDPAEDPTEIDLQGTPDSTGATYFDVSKVVQNYFNADISKYALPIGGGSLVQDAYATTALFYEVTVAEVYDSPGADAVFDPFDGEEHAGCNVFFTDTDYRVAVNAVHPATYTDEVISSSTPTTLDWSTANLSAYVVGGGPDIGQNYVQKFLTHMPRTRTMGSGDYFRLHMLTNDSALLEVPERTVDFLLVVRDYSSGTDAGSVLEQAITLADATAAFSIGVGPADLAAFITVPSRYRVYIGVENTTGDPGPAILRYSELVDITVDSKCTEQSTPVIVLNPLGGIDSYSFTGRKWDTGKDGFGALSVSTKPITNSVRKWLVNLLFKRGKSLTVSKYSSPGTGYDWTERAYQGPIAVTRLSATIVAPLIVDGPDGPVAEVSTSYTRELTMDYHLGVDQISQQG